MDNDKDIDPHEQLTDHEYDGIQEFDNPTPGWWTFLFILSCIFGIIYFVFFHMGQAGQTIHEKYEAAVAENLERQFADIGELQPDGPTLKRLMKDSDLLTFGKSIFAANCVSCHGADGAGLVGPNLTDEQWKSVNRLEDIVQVVSEGAGNGAMPGWKTRLHSNEIILASAYVASLRGQNRIGPRGPEGTEIPAWGD